ncbi:MAG: hypothetical protein WBP85_00225 [Terracidiphilus sp.]
MILPRMLCIVAVAVCIPLRAQFICVPGTNCSCDDEKLSPNLTLLQSAKLDGALFDPTGTPMGFENTFVEIRDPGKNKVLASALVDGNGRFDLGQIPRGTFRLIALLRQNGKVRRLPGFDQPAPLSCPVGTQCHVTILLKIHGTDQPFEFCPPK